MSGHYWIVVGGTLAAAGNVAAALIIWRERRTRSEKMGSKPVDTKIDELRVEETKKREIIDEVKNTARSDDWSDVLSEIAKIHPESRG